MAVVDLTYAPDPIFKKKASPIEVVDESTRAVVKDMFDTLYEQRGIGLAAPMIGNLSQIIVVDLQEGESSGPTVMINPVIIDSSEDMQTHTEASLSFPGIQAEITRPKSITVEYLDEQGNEQSLIANDWYAQVIQHEIDYLDGKVFLDHLKPMKRQMLLKKMQKFKKQMDHQHGPNCGCGH